jgi:hypothetical protein
MIAHILALDIAGNPFDWISPEDAVLYYAAGKVAWELGERQQVFRGGYSRAGVQSRITVKPIIAITGSEIMARMLRTELPLGNQNHLLFKRDRYTCAYCGNRFAHKDLSRDHVLAQRRGGKDTWMNCVTSCRVRPPNQLLVPHRSLRNVSSARSASPRRTSYTHQYGLLVQ